MNIFEKASKVKLRFNTVSGTATVEDLWDLPLTTKRNTVCLDDIARTLYKELKESEEISFVTPSSAKNTLIQLRFDIVKHVIETKLEEAKKAEEAAINKDRKEKILAIMEEKEAEGLKNLTIDELRAML